MKSATSEVIPSPGSTPKDVLSEVLRAGAQQMLGKAIQDEVAAYVDEHAGQRNQDGHRLVVRNGSHKSRAIQTGTDHKRGSFRPL